MTKTKRILSVVMSALMLVFTCMTYVPASAAEVAANAPEIAFVGVDHSPLVVGDKETFSITTNNADKVMYNVVLKDAAGKTVEDLTNGWTTEKVGNVPFELKANTVFALGKYTLVIDAKRVSDSKTLAKPYVANLNCVSKDDANRIYANGAVDIAKADYALGEKVTVNGIKDLGGIAGPYQYKLHVYNATTGVWTKNAVANYGDKIDWTPTAAGTYVLDIYVNSQKSTTWAKYAKNPTSTDTYGTYEAWKLVTVNVTDKFAVQSVSAVKANTLKVTLNGAVDTTKAVLTVKKGTTTIATAAPVWNAAKTEATIVKSSSNFVAGDYTVTLSGLDNIDAAKASGAVTVKDQTVTKIEFLGSDIVKNAAGSNASFKYVVKDQYGEDMTKYVTLSSSASVAGLVLDPSTATGTITHDFATDVTLKTVVIVLVDPTTGVNATATLNVANAIKVQSVEFGTVKLPTGLTRLQKSTTVSTMPVIVKDQYGNVITNTTTLGNAIDLLSSSSAKVTFAFANDADGNAIINIDTTNVSEAITVLLTAVVKGDGRTFTKTFDVAMPAAAKSLTFGELSKDVVAVNDVIYVPVTVIDQFGTELTKDDIASQATAIGNMITVPSNVTANGIVTDRNNSHYGQYKFTANTTGTGVLVSTSTSGVVTKTITVKAARVVTDVVAPATINLMQGASKANLGFKFYDQYGTEMDAADNASMKYAVTLDKVSGDNGAVTSTFAPQYVAGSAATIGTDETDLATIPAAAAASLTGTYKLTVKLVKSTVTDTVNSSDVLSSASVVINTVKNNVSGLTYSIEAIPTLAGNSGSAYDQTSKYARSIKVVAKDASGNSYVINPADIVAVSSSNPAVADVHLGTMKVFGKDITGSNNTADKTATITATINTLDGLKTATATVTVSTAAPVVKELNVLTNSIAAQNSGTAWTQDDLPDTAVTKLTYDTVKEDAWQLGVNFYLVGKDQYGVWSDLATSTIVVNTTNYCPYNAFTLVGGKLTLAADPVVYTAAKDLRVTIINGQAVKEITVQILAN